MKLESFMKIVCAVLLVGMPTVFGFVPAARLLSNTTKSRLMLPLRLDTALGLVKNNNDDASTPPRGIVLNSSLGGLTFAGGLLGYVTKGSKASLIAGSTFGGLLMVSAFLISKLNRNGNILGAGSAGMLSYVMGKKFLVSKKMMPAGLLAFLGCMTFVYNVIETIFIGGYNQSEQNENETDLE